MNTLYPIFLKLSKLSVLVVGGGKVASEKLQFLLKSSPDACIKVVAKDIADEIVNLNQSHLVTLHKKAFEEQDLQDVDILIVATSNTKLNDCIYKLAKEKNILVNVADTPAKCDFYLGSIVTKGEVKIAISTNGKSPTLAKRLRQLLEAVLPDNLNELANNLNEYREKLQKDIHEKIDKLNKLTEDLLK